ncbi:MAG: flagellin, partial [Verrucomicrobiia bacterium]
MVINTNVAATRSANNLQASQSALSKSLARLSSGKKIIDPSDDAAGMAVAARMTAKVSR